MPPTRSVDHADLQSEMSQVGHDHLLLLLTIRLDVRINPVDGVVHDLQVPPRPRQVLRDHPSTRHRHRRAHHPSLHWHPHCSHRLQFRISIRSASVGTWALGRRQEGGVRKGVHAIRGRGLVSSALLVPAGSARRQGQDPPLKPAKAAVSRKPRGKVWVEIRDDEAHTARCACTQQAAGWDGCEESLRPARSTHALGWHVCGLRQPHAGADCGPHCRQLVLGGGAGRQWRAPATPSPTGQAASVCQARPACLRDGGAILVSCQRGGVQHRL